HIFGDDYVGAQAAYVGQNYLADGDGGLEPDGIDGLHHPEDVLFGDGAVETHADQGQPAPVHRDAGGDGAAGVGELLADVVLPLGAGGPGDGAHPGALVFGGDLTAVGADDTGKGPCHDTLTSRSPDVSSRSALTGSWS